MWKPIAVAGFVLAAIASAGIGSYLAVRHNGAPATATGTSDPLEMAANLTGAATLDRPVLATGPVDVSEDMVENPAVDEPAPDRAPARLASVNRASAEPPAPAPVAPQPTEPQRRSTPVPATPSVVESAPAPSLEPMATTEPEPTTPARAPNSVPAVDTERTERPVPELPPVDGWTRADGETPAPPAPAAEPVSAPDANRLPPDDRESREGLIASNVWNSARPIATSNDPRPAVVELEIAADSVIGLRVDTGVSTHTARVEDTVEARVTRDVQVDNVIAVPSGTRVLGSVVLSEQGGRLRDASRLGVRFHTLVMDDGVKVPMVTETIYRAGQPPGKDSVAKIGGAAVGGAILGAIFGGNRGATIGGSIGAAGGTAAAMNGEADPAGLPPGTRVTVRLSRPAAITVQR